MAAFPTDWILFRRLARELEGALRGGRLTDVGLLDDGRTAFRIAGRRGAPPITLAADPHGSPPLVTLEEAELALGRDPGWLRTAGTTLRGMRVASVQARRGDRVLVVALGTESRFGVASGAKIVFELVPRFGNVVVLRDRTVVAALAQFAPGENAARAVQLGLPYEPPPLPAASVDRAGFVAALAGDRKARVRALGAYRPLLPRLLAESVVTEVEATGLTDPPAFAARLEARADAVLAEAESRAGEAEPLFCYRRGAVAIAAHVVPLAQFPDAAQTREPELLALVREARSAAGSAQAGDAAARRRARLAQRIAKRLDTAGAERAALALRHADAAARDRLRRAGDALNTHYREVPEGATSFVAPTDLELGAIALDPLLDARANARAYHARYRKASDALPHLERRLARLDALALSLDELADALERAEGPQVVDEIAAAFDALEGRTPPKARALTRLRAPLRVDLPSGARCYVGRSPRENDEVTFRLARPDDLWFHARGIPGAHVVLQAAPGSAPADDELDAAADLAAAYSRARDASRVEIDFTERKYVRKRRDGAPGLVWYTNARTRVGRPDGAARYVAIVAR